MDQFVTGSHPRLRYWGVDNAHGIRTRAELRARARDASGEYLPWFIEELFRAADAAEPWQRVQDGAVLSCPGAHVAVVAKAGGTVEGVTSGARLAVIDLDRRRAAGGETASLRLPNGKALRFGSSPFLAW
ncbi:MAG: hypothetical protein HQ592_03460 [Planctomycetes bacterium]|nr:hypothetical protein [Planctomycetota bacterium]